MIGQGKNAESAASQQTEKIVSSTPLTPVVSPYLEVQMKAKAEFSDFSRSLFQSLKGQKKVYEPLSDLETFSSLTKSLDYSIDQVEQASASLSTPSADETKPPSPERVIESAVGALLDSAATHEAQRVTDFSDLYTKPQLDHYVDDLQGAEDSASILAALDDIPRDTHNKKELVRDIMRVRVLRAYNQVNDKRSVVNRLIQEEPPINSELTGLISVSDERKIARFITEVQKYGVDGVELYYNTLNEIKPPVDAIEKDKTHKKIQSCSDVDSLAHAAAQKIRNMELPRDEKILLERNIAEQAKIRRSNIRDYSTGVYDKKKIQAKVEEVQMKKELFDPILDDAWEALQENTPDEQKVWILNHAPKPIIDFLFSLKRLGAKVSDAGVTPEMVALYGWQMRLRSDELATVFNKFSEVVKTPDFTRFKDRIKDEFLQTEASGFEIHENLKIRENVSTEALLRESMNSLLKIHRPRGQDKVYFTVLYGEDKIQKIEVATKEDITSEELDDNITQALLSAHINDVQLSFQERAELGYKRYSLKREQDETYKKIYKHGDNLDINGDYLIQIKGHTNATAYSEDTTDEYSPATLFAVDGNQAALLLDKRHLLNRNIEAVKTTLRYKHSKKDGGPAYVHSQKVFTALRALKADRYTDLEEGNSQLLDAHIESLAEVDDIGAPLLEARSVYTEHNEAYPTLQFKYTDKKGTENALKLSPAFTRAFIYGLANDVDVFHYLHAAAKENNIFFDEKGDQFDALQPLYTSFHRLKGEFEKFTGETKGTMDPAIVQKWLASFNGQKGRAEMGYCDMFVLAAAPPGKYEAQFSNANGLVHGGGIMLTAPKGGMYSGLAPQPESDVHLYADEDRKDTFNTTFLTAQASNYNNIPIDLAHATPCMGVVGYLQRGDVAVSTCRKMPCQAQSTFRTEFLALVPQLLDKEKKVFLKQLNPLLEKWDGLLKGKDGAYTLTDYIEERKRVYDTLMSEDSPAREKFMSLNYTDSTSFQAYLDGILQKSADDTLHAETILTTKTQFVEFMKAAGVDASIKRKK